MKEHPILFSTPMVQAILDGRKTMTRRVVKPQPQGHVSKLVPLSEGMGYGFRYDPPVIIAPGVTNHGNIIKCPYGQPGDPLWVRETWDYADDSTQTKPVIAYHAGKSAANSEPCWRPSIHMPRWASRITLEVTSVRVERVNDISEVDAKAEGINEPEYPDYSFTGWAIAGFAELWDKINEKRGYAWDSNPWVWVVEFKVI